MDKATIENLLYNYYLEKSISKTWAKALTQDVMIGCLVSMVDFLQSVSDEQIIGNPTYEVYNNYENWCREHTSTPIGKIAFSRKMKTLGYRIEDKKIHDKKYRIFQKAVQDDHQSSA